MENGIGSIVEGKVTGITKFGAFVSIPGGKSGLVHISEIANQYVSDVSEHLSEGQQVKVKIISVDEQGRINLSIKKADETPRPSTPRQGAPRQGGQGYRDRDNQGSRGGNAHGNSGGYAQQRKPQSFQGRTATKEPADFEDRLKQFMASSDSKLSEMRHQEKKGTRRKK